MTAPATAPLIDDDATLLRAYASDASSTAFEALFARHAPMVRATCRRVLGDDAAADDAAQAAFLVLMRRARRLEPGPLGPWLHRTAVLCARNLARARARRERGERDAARIAAAPPVERAAPTGIDEALAALPLAQREAIVLRYVDGLSSEETARRLGCAEKTVRSRLLRGLRALRRRLGGRAVPLGVLVALLASRARGAEGAPWAGAEGATATARACAARVLAGTARAAATALAGGVVALAATLLVAARLAGPATPHAWTMGFFVAADERMPASAIPWADYDDIVHFSAAAGADGSVAPGTLDAAGIAALIAARPGGKRVLVAIGDQTGGDVAAATAPDVVDRFVANIAAYVHAHGYDGVDVDWLQRVDVERYCAFLPRLRAALPHAMIAMEAGNWERLDEVAARCQGDVDRIDVLCYDLDTGRERAWHDSALAAGDETDGGTAEWRLATFVARGIAPAKLGIGMPFYARRWTGASGLLESARIADSPAYGDLIADPLRWRDEYRRWDEVHRAEYLAIAPLGEFISFAGERSMHEAAAWAHSRGMGGVSTFPLDGEYRADAREPHPLSRALRAALDAR